MKHITRLPVDANGKPCSSGKINENFKWENWYNYIAASGADDSTVSRWANAVTDDGSYFVWIPRFKYKVNGTTNVDVIFVSVEDKSGANGYTTSNTDKPRRNSVDSIHNLWNNKISGWKIKWKIKRRLMKDLKTLKKNMKSTSKKTTKNIG